MQIKLNSVLVDNQDKALKFYTEVLGFVKKFDIPMGEFRWLTVVEKDRDDLELVLEPMGFEPAKVFQAALFTACIPFTALATTDIEADYVRLKNLGVVFRGAPQQAGPIKTVVFEDSCGNLINLYQV